MYSNADLIKQVRAQDLYREYATSGRILLITHLTDYTGDLGVFCSRTAQVEVAPYPRTRCRYRLIGFATSDIREAMEKEARYQISFWDALVLNAAEAGGAE